MLNLDALKKEDTKLSKGGFGKEDVLYFTKMKTDSEQGIRIMPPSASLNGIYYKERIIYWIDKKPVLSPETFGRFCPIDEELREAQNSGDDDAMALASNIKKRRDYAFAALVFSDEDCTEIDGGKAMIAVCGQTLIEDINKLALSRHYQPDITDRKVGYNIFVDKSGTGLDTTYKAIADKQATEQDPKYYKNVPDVVEWIEGDIRSEDYLRALIREHLYGEAMPQELKDEWKNSKKAPVKDKVETEASSKEVSTKKAERANTKEPEAKEEKAPIEKDDKPKSRKSLLDDMNDID